MYRDFLQSVRTGAPPEMSLERALEDHLLMDRVYASLGQPAPVAVAR
jgi:predicted dehydrogenase